MDLSCLAGLGGEEPRRQPRGDSSRRLRIVKLARQLAKLKTEGLALYKPLPAVERFHASMAKFRVVDGSNRCISADQEIYDPVTGATNRVKDISGPFHVYAMDPSTGRLVVSSASKPFVKGRGKMYRLRLSNGQSIEATKDHCSLSSIGKWVSVRDAIAYSVPLLDSHALSVSCASPKTHTRHPCHSPVLRTPPKSAVSYISSRLHSETANCALGSYMAVALLEPCLAPESRHSLTYQAGSQYDQSASSRQHKDEQSLAAAGGVPGRRLSPSVSADALPSSTSGTCPLVFQQGEQRYLHTALGWKDDYPENRHFCDAQLPAESDTSQDEPPLLVGAQARSNTWEPSQRDAQGNIEPGAPCSPLSRLSIQDAYLHSADPYGGVECHISSVTSRLISERMRTDLLSPAGSTAGQRTAREVLVPSEHWSVELPYHPPVFTVPRKPRTYCTIVKVECLGTQDIWDITVKGHANYAAGGLIHANSGKTNAGAVETCRILCGADPHDKAVKKNAKALIVGLDGDHLAMMWGKCAHPGAFSIIRDEHTNLWRAVRPDPNDPLRLDPYDEAYREKWKDSPPLLPERMIRSIAWEEKGKGIPRRVLLANGWDSLWRSSKGSSPQGEHLNLVWIDEQIENEDFFEEGRRGIVGLKETTQHTPRMIWSATPQNMNQQLSDLREQAESSSGDVEAFKLLISDNPYIPDAEKQAFFNGLSEDERDVRWFGNAAISRQRVYPGYDPQGTHGCEPFTIDISRWSRYIALDPGRQHCGTVFFAIDPSEEHAWIYDAFDLRNADATAWAGEVAKRQYDTQFEAFVIDQQMGRQTRPGAGHNVAQQYSAALEEAGVIPHNGAVGSLGVFYPGTNDIPAREEALLRWLSIRGTGPFAGSPTLQVMKGISPQLDKQFRDARYQRGKRYQIPAQDILVCVEYMAAFNPKYREPTAVAAPTSERNLSVRDQFVARQRRTRKRHRTTTAIH